MTLGRAYLVSSGRIVFLQDPMIAVASVPHRLERIGGHVKVPHDHEPHLDYA